MTEGERKGSKETSSEFVNSLQLHSSGRIFVTHSEQELTFSQARNRVA